MQRTDDHVQVPRVAIAAAWAALVSAIAAACSSTTPLSPARRDAAASGGPVVSETRTGTQSQGVSSPAAAGSGAHAGCAARESALAEARRAVETAHQRKADAWKLVMPLAVVARRAQAGSELETAERQLAEQRALAAREGCAAGH